MTDHFAVLCQSRRPWLASRSLRDTFHRLSAILHPDVPHTGDAAGFATLNTAYATLCDPAARIRHLLELEVPSSLAKPEALPDLGDLFMKVAAVRQSAERCRLKRDAAPNSLARALLAPETAAMRRDLESARSDLETAHQLALAELRALDARWDAADVGSVAQLAGLHGRLVYLGKWVAQLRETIFLLSS